MDPREGHPPPAPARRSQLTPVRERRSPFPVSARLVRAPSAAERRDEKPGEGVRVVPGVAAMRITGSAIGVETNHVKETLRRKHEKVEIAHRRWRLRPGEGAGEDETGSETAPADGLERGIRELADELTRALEQADDALREAVEKAASAAPEKAAGKKGLDLEEVLSIVVDQVRSLLELLTGREVKILDPDDLAVDLDGDGKAEDLAEAAERAEEATEEAKARKLKEDAAREAERHVDEWKLAVEIDETYIERESTSFRASGTVETADGRRIDLHLELELNREVRVERHFRLSAEKKLSDPLVLDLDGVRARLSGETVELDLDGDGEVERVPFPGGGSPFLVLDRDGDGRVTDGSELFGPRSGDGFAELARLDADGNGWIDEGDPAWDRLRLWLGRGPDGDRLVGLSDAGVGAIWLGHAATPFRLDGPDLAQLGEVRATGIFLREDGTAGTVRQLDLVT